MRWNALQILPITLAMGVWGCQAEPVAQDPAIGELRKELETLRVAQRAQYAELAAAEVALGRLEAEKATRAEFDAFASMRRPWTVSLPLESARLEGPGATWTALHSGLAFQEAGFARFHVGFTLPDAYVEGSDLELRLTWIKDPLLFPDCQFRLVSNGAKVSRNWQSRLFPESRFRGDPDGGAELFPAPSDALVREIVVDIQGTMTDGKRLRAGDHLTYALYREPADPEDTCTGGNATAIFLGMSAHPKAE